MTGALCGITADTANAASPEGKGKATTTQAAPDAQARVVDSSDVCVIFGLGSSAGGMQSASKALAKGATWVGIGATIGCYWYSQGKEVTPAKRRAVMRKSYKKYKAKSARQRLYALGYYCRKEGGGGGGGTDSDSVEQKAGYRTIKLKGVKYKCTNIRD